MTSSSRRRAIAIAALLAAAIPALAACGAGFGANTNTPYAPNEAGVLIKDDGSGGKSYGENGVMIPQAFILGPEPGSQIAAGGSAAVYLTMLNSTGTPDTLTGIVADQQQAASAKVPAPVALEPGTLAKTPGVTVDGIKQPLRGGETLRLTLQFKNAGDISLAVPVIARSREYATLSPAPSPAATPTGDPFASLSPTGTATDATATAETGTGTESAGGAEAPPSPAAQ
ncbi:copper chaperone PCu(A)C [Microbispora sp. RL4-1S]|uniref:Copper chaperone PCu(A)C n=1 Tax=Microbispora oryzae TaxID=2806554 RepID=A0A941AQN6_9ACTN|nr:copper chaperone PCu(A)C [Microbispora oryzae]MBP2704969.1 copper chaperone PCu(A)C [Microbispora oryzae]